MTSSIRANMLALAGISLFWWGLLGLSGNLTTGYNLRDDHQILQIAAEVKADGIAATTRHWVAHDYRFRPVYFGHRICEVIVLGDNLLSWSIYTAFLGFLSSSLFYLAFRALGFSSLESLTFVFFALVGPQGEVWWRRGTNETIGMVFVALTSLALAWSARSRSPISRVTFFAAAMVMSCCKESFILLLPAILLALVWAVRSAFGMSWKEAARTCSAELVGLLSVMVAELALIKLSLGTEVMGYAGIEDITLAQVWRTGWRLVRIGNVWWAIAGMWVLILLTSRRRWPGRDGLVPGALTLLIVVPQAWLHAKSGVFGRYYLPGALGIAILLGCCMRAGDSTHRYFTFSKSRWARSAVVVRLRSPREGHPPGSPSDSRPRPCWWGSSCSPLRVARPEGCTAQPEPGPKRVPSNSVSSIPW